jgi:hypothetical protein
VIAPGIGALSDCLQRNLETAMSDDLSARLALPYLAAGQMQKHVTLNEALTRLDVLVQTAVASRTVASQPGAPEEGEMFILPTGATGSVWGEAAGGALMRFEMEGWREVAVPPGVIAFVIDAGEFLVRTADGWSPVGERLRIAQNLERLGVGTSADSDNPFAARVNKALWTALEAGAGGDGDLRFTFNKEGAGDVLSLLFQSGWSGRAELGLIGDDDLGLKVSADGSTWRDVLRVDRTSGRALFAVGAGRRETTTFSGDGDYTPPAWARTVEAVLVGGGGGGGAGVFGATGARFGGGGGGAGGVAFASWPAEQLAAGLTVTVGGGGGGGSAGAGGDGADSMVTLDGVVLCTATGGRGGGLGDSSAGVGGRGGEPGGNAGGASSISVVAEAGESLVRPDGPGGGGAGGGLDSASIARAGGPGGDGGRLAVVAGGGASGAGTAGMAAILAPQPALHWSGGGGGGGGASNSGDGHAGGAGAWAGGGGGGGGAGVTAGGAGGSGSSGVVWLTVIG